MKYWTTWQPPLMQAIPPSLRIWLTDTGSLTRLLQQACEQEFSVNLLRTQWHRPLADEALLLRQRPYRRLFQREVHLLDGKQPQIYARTLVPMETYRTMRARFSELGNQSLGEMLFTDPSLQRGPIQVARLLPDMAQYAMATRDIDARPDCLWARRSCFYLNGKALLVSEVFLPSDKWSAE
jgi:chorismate--pyruvate lyase